MQTGDAQAGECLPQGLRLWAGWQSGQWAGCSSHERALHGTAQSRAVPNRGLVQLKGRARPWALPNQGLCQAAGPTGWSDMPNGEPCQVWAVPAWGPHWVMSCAKLGSMPESKPCQTPRCASPLCLGSQNHLSSQLPSASSPNLRVPATSVAPSLWGPSWKEPRQGGKVLEETGSLGRNSSFYHCHPAPGRCWGCPLTVTLIWPCRHIPSWSSSSRWLGEVTATGTLGRRCHIQGGSGRALSDPQLPLP